VPLVLIDHNEGHLGPSRLQDDITPAANDHRSPLIFEYRDHAAWLMKSTFKKNAISGSVKSFFTAKNRRYNDCLLVRPTAARRSARSPGSESADFDATPIAQYLNRRILGTFRHGQ